MDKSICKAVFWLQVITYIIAFLAFVVIISTILKHSTVFKIASIILFGAFIIAAILAIYIFVAAIINIKK